jgi:hypothetical protein
MSRAGSTSGAVYRYTVAGGVEAQMPAARRRQVTFDEDACRAFCLFLRAIHAPYGVTELVGIAHGEPLVMGWFDEVESMVDALRNLPPGYEGFYGLNPRFAELQDRACNRLQALPSRGQKSDVSAITLMLFDIDVVTPARKQAATLAGMTKAPCTDEEHANAIALAGELKRRHFPDGWVIGTNGAQLIVQVAMDGTLQDLLVYERAVKGGLREIAALVRSEPSSLALEIDTGVGDLPRIAAMPGTVKCKGKQSRTRHHRLVHVVQPGTETLGDVPTILLKQVELARTPELPRLERAPAPARRRLTNPPRTDAPLLDRPGSLDRLCAGWNRVYTSVEAAPSGGRSVVLKALISKFVDVGVERPDIHTMVGLHDTALGRKLAQEHSPETYIDREIDGEGKVASCDWVIGAIGAADQCLGCPDYRPMSDQRRGTAPRGHDLAGSAAPRPSGSLEEGRAMIRDELRTYLAGAGDGQLLLVKGPPGIGKTTAMIAEAQNIIDAGGHLLLVVDRVELLEEVVRQIDRPDHVQPVLGKRRNILVDGETVPLCLEPQRLTAVSSQGLQAVEGAVACGECPSRESCRYQMQFKALDKTWVVTAAMLRFIVRDGATLNQAPVVILDEGARQAFTPDREDVGRDDLARATALGFDVGVVARAWAELDGASNTGGRGFGFRVARGLRARGENVGTLFSLSNRMREHNTGQIASHGTDLVPLPVIRLLQVLAEEVASSGPNSRLQVTPLAVEIRSPFTLALEDSIKVVVLDGTGNPAVYRDAIGRPVRTVDPKLQRHAQVYQLTAGSYGKGTQERDSRARDKLFAQVSKIVAARGTPTSPVTVVVFRGVKAPMEQVLAGLHGIVIHYWATRGTNALLDAGSHDIVLVGTPTPQPADMLAWAEARAWKHSTPIDRNNYLALHRYGLPGTDRASDTLHYRDPHVEAWASMEREGELLQAAERIRTMIASEAPKTVWLMTRLPVPGLEPDLLFADVAEILDG